MNQDIPTHTLMPAPITVSRINHANIFSPRLRLSYPSVDLFYWSPESGVNFGDELGRTVVELMLARKGMTLFDEAPQARRLLTVGSILQFAKDDSVIWGAGRHGNVPPEEHLWKKLDVRAVRGPKTLEFLKSKGIDAPGVFGDPALLLPMLTQGRFVPTGELEAAFVPNLGDYAKIDFSHFDIPVIDPRRSWNKVVNDILKCKFLLASSLHGLVVAEAFGIPARYVRLTENENIFKYHDYYEGTGRYLSQVFTSIPEALKAGGEKPIQCDLQKLIESFPYDLWQ
ncbi:MAG: polysaccharide pyruvyl transferase family protein [Alphaproteobacteria bacterium]|nr:polysaccharide pyruvyl transferase family protein [Alphaproteobacteria bacterium]